MPVVVWMLPLFIRQIVFVEGFGYSHFPTGIDDKPIKGKELQFNLDDVVLNFLYDYAKTIRANLWDFDVMGKNSNRPKNDRYPVVGAKIFGMTPGAAETVSMKPMVAYSQLFHNGQPDRNETATINKQIKHHNTYTYTVERGIDTGLTGRFSAGIPQVAGAETEISTKLSTLWGSTTTKTTETTYSLIQVVNVPPESTVQVQMLITEEVVNIPWDCTMNLKGYFAGQFEIGSRREWKFFGIGILQHPDLEKKAYDEILFRAHGTFRGITAKSSRTVTREKRHYN
uniref:Putative cytotoxin-like protein n=1 Tax=Ixodes ricinus TaxID=34613 RepID=A0A6B0V5P6_IXORI